MRTGRRAGFGVLPLTLLAALVALAPTLAAAGVISEVPLCLHACQSSLRAVRFADEDGGTTQRARECRGALRQTSLYLCTREHCGADDRIEGLAALNATCEAEEQGALLPPFEDTVGKYTDEDVARLERFDRTGQPPVEPAEGPALPTERAWTSWRDTLVRGNQDLILGGRTEAGERRTLG
jgi:hypothetical protein